MLVSVRSLAQWQLNCAWVLGIVIYLHVASVRVLRCFFGYDSARAIILLPQNRIDCSDDEAQAAPFPQATPYEQTRIKIAAHDLAGLHELRFTQGFAVAQPA